MLYGPSGSVVVRSSGRTPRAERNEQTEEAVRIKLKSIDSLLDIVYVEWAGRYSLICQWPQTDPRWEMYQKGELGAPYDSLGWYCQDMQDPSSLPVDVDSIEQLVMARLASCDNTQYPWRDRMREIIAKNAKVRQSRKDKVLERVEEVAGTLFTAAGHMDQHQFERLLEEVEEGKH